MITWSLCMIRSVTVAKVDNIFVQIPSELSVLFTCPLSTVCAISHPDRAGLSSSGIVCLSASVFIVHVFCLSVCLFRLFTFCDCSVIVLLCHGH